MNVYTCLLLLATVCLAYSAECPKGTGEDTFAYKKYTGVKGEVELNLKEVRPNVPPVIAVKVRGGKVKVEAEVNGAKKDIGSSKGKDGNVHFAEPIQTDKLFFTPEGTDSFAVMVSVCYPM